MTRPGLRVALAGILAALSLASPGCAFDDDAEPAGPLPAQGQPPAEQPGSGKADGAGEDGAAGRLEHLDHGTWTEPSGDGEQIYAVLRAWVDARVRNERFHKRVFVEVDAPYAGGAHMRTLYPAWFKSAHGAAHERWGTDAIELYLDGGPHGAKLEGTVHHRLRLQSDVDGDGTDEMVLTSWRPLHQVAGASAPPAATEDPWRPDLDSPVVPEATPAPARAWFAPFDDPGAQVMAEVDRVIAAQQADPAGRHTIHAAVFNINDPRIVDRLIAAHRAGVEVRLVTEATKLRPWRTWQTEDDRLLAAGVPLLGLRRAGRGAMHVKLALFDGSRLGTGSFNWEVGSSSENHENMLLSEHPSLLAAYAARFEAIAGSPLRPRAAANSASEPVAALFGPDEAPHRAMAELIDGAQTSVHVCMFTCKDVEFTEDGQPTSLFRKLIAAHQRGVDVLLLTDFGIAEASEYYGVLSEDDPMDEWLESEGIHVVRADNTFGRYASMHHKFVVVDGQVLVTGAYNWYYDSAYLNDEDMLILHDEALAARYTGEIIDLLRRYDPEFDAERWPAVELELTAERADTSWGDVVLVVGELPELGAWDPAQGLALRGQAWPRWSAKLRLPWGVRSEYKLVVRRSDGRLEWEPGDNRLLTAPSGSAGASLTIPPR